MAKLSKKEKVRLEEIDTAMRLTMSSLESHIYYTHDGQLIRGETHQFHKDCVKEYAKILLALANQL